MVDQGGDGWKQSARRWDGRRKSPILPMVSTIPVNMMVGVQNGRGWSFEYLEGSFGDIGSSYISIRTPPFKASVWAFR